MTRKRTPQIVPDEGRKTIEVESVAVDSTSTHEASSTSSEAPPESPEPPLKSPTGPTKTELEAAVAELKAALAEAKQTAQTKEQNLLQQIVALQADLQTQADLIQSLKREVQQAQTLKTELEEAKQVILQLSQVNVKPQAESPKATVPVQAAEPELEVAKVQILPPRPMVTAPTYRTPSQPLSNLPKPSSLPPLPKPSASLSARRPIETKPIEEPRIKSDAKLSDADMGWVD